MLLDQDINQCNKIHEARCKQCCDVFALHRVSSWYIMGQSYCSADFGQCSVSRGEGSRLEVGGVRGPLLEDAGTVWNIARGKLASGSHKVLSPLVSQNICIVLIIIWVSVWTLTLNVTVHALSLCQTYANALTYMEKQNGGKPYHRPGAMIQRGNKFKTKLIGMPPFKSNTQAFFWA